MKEKKIFYIFVILFVTVSLFNNLFSQVKGTRIIGTVKTDDGLKLANATVMIVDTDNKATTNNEGEYSLTTLKKGKLLLIAFLEGFEKDTKEVLDSKKVLELILYIANDPFIPFR